MGISAYVQMENTGLWNPRISSSLEEALESMKRFLGLNATDEHDECLQELLQRRFAFKNGRYLWPREARSPLIYWQAGDES